jgi:hypothetical protein
MNSHVHLKLSAVVPYVALNQKPCEHSTKLINKSTADVFFFHSFLKFTFCPLFICAFNSLYILQQYTCLVLLLILLLVIMHGCSCAVRTVLFNISSFIGMDLSNYCPVVRPLCIVLTDDSPFGMNSFKQEYHILWWIVFFTLGFGRCCTWASWSYSQQFFIFIWLGVIK